MRTRCGMLLAVVIAMCGAAGCAQKGDPAVVAEAVEAGEQWLGLVDGGDYGASWETASSLFRGAVEKGRWEQMMSAVRRPMGKNLSRSLKRTRYTTSAPGAPDGEYVIIEFKAAFERKATAIETVTPMRDTNGEWRVSGYFIK